MDIREIVAHAPLPALNWLGKAPQNWIESIANDNGTSTFRTNLKVLHDHAGNSPHQKMVRALSECAKQQKWANVVYYECVSRFIADGPKVFRPTEEQWESMENVEANIPFDQLRIPYPSIAIRIPSGCRKRLMEQFSISNEVMPHMVLLRHYNKPGEAPFMFYLSRFGEAEVFNILRTHGRDGVVEDILNKEQVHKYGIDKSNENEHSATIPMTRACVNLGIMLTHYGCHVTGPTNPHEYEKHRRKKHLEHLKHGDFLAIEMKQNIVIRHQSSVPGQIGNGTGIEVAPHWRKGHWRAFPGQGARRAAGEKVDLLFVRPCLVRSDRIKGDIADSEVVYHGRE